MSGLTIRQKEIANALKDASKDFSPAVAQARIRELCIEFGYDPLREMIEAASTGTVRHVSAAGKISYETLDGKDVIGIHKQIAKYMVPELRSLEVKSEIDVNVNVSIRRFSEDVTKQPKTLEGEVTMIQDVAEDLSDGKVVIKRPALDELHRDKLLALAVKHALDVTASTTPDDLKEKLGEFFDKEDASHVVDTGEVKALDTMTVAELDAHADGLGIEISGDKAEKLDKLKTALAVAKEKANPDA